MNETFALPATIQQISKQLNRINRIAAALSKRNPSIANQIDQIIDASLKIQKIMHSKNNKGSTTNLRHSNDSKNKDKIVQQDYDFENCYQLGDQYYNDAMVRIQKCMNKFGKFQRKMNILIHQSKFGFNNKIAKSKSSKVFATNKNEKQYGLRDSHFRGKLQSENKRNAYEETQNKYKKRLRFDQNESDSQKYKNQKNNNKNSEQKLKIKKQQHRNPSQFIKLKQIDEQIKYIIEEIRKSSNQQDYVQQIDEKQYNRYNNSNHTFQEQQSIQ